MYTVARQLVCCMQDMAPYVPLLMPELQSALVDPLPEVRATAAHALGSLLRGMGEQHFQGLMPWLLATLNSEVRTCQQFYAKHASVPCPLMRGAPKMLHKVHSCLSGQTAP